MQSPKERRTGYYTFTSKKQLITFYTGIISKKELTDLIKKIESEPFIDRKDGNHRLDKLKKLEWNINRYIKDNYERIYY